MKKTITNISLLLCLLAAACGKSGKDDIKKNEENNPDNSTVITYEGKWQVPAGNTIQPLAVNHRSDIPRIFHVKGKEYHYKHVFTGYQHQYGLCEFENDQWTNCLLYGPNNQEVNATDHQLITISFSNSGVDRPSSISTGIYNPGETSFTYHQQTLPQSVNRLSLATTENDIYLICRWQVGKEVSLFKWNNSTKLWEMLIESVPDSNIWNTFSVIRGLPGEFIVEVQWNEFYFYRFRNNQFEKIYQGTESLEEMISANIHPINGQYVLTLDKVYILGADNTLTTYFTPEERQIVGSSSHKDKLFLMMGSYSGLTKVPYVHHLLVLDLTNKKIHRLPTDVNHAGYYGEVTLSSTQHLTGWLFRINTDNKVEAIADLGYFATLTQAYRLVFPTTLK